MDPLTYIHDESVRQSATVAEMAGMCDAYDWLLSCGKSTVSEHMIKILAKAITGKGGYRHVPAVFNQGQPAVAHFNIPRCMENLVEWINDNTLRGSTVDVDVQIREFLLIHPFADGNGRVASLLRNYLLGTLNDPAPLPYYFGDN